MFCTKCGKKISLGAEFCGFCGTPITQEQEEIRDSNQNIKSVKSDYSSDWSNKQNESRLDRREKDEPPLMEETMKKATKKTWFYRFLFFLTPIVVFGGLFMGLDVMLIPAGFLIFILIVLIGGLLLAPIADAIVSMLGKMKVLSTILFTPVAIVITAYAYDRWGVFMASMMGLGSLSIYHELWFGTEKKKK